MEGSEALNINALGDVHLVLLVVQLADYAKRLPSLVEMHLRGLALMYRLALACCSLEDLWEVGPSIVTTAYNCINETIAPMLIQDPALLSGAVRYLPRGMYSAADSTPLLIKVMNRCDVTLVAVQQQRQQQQQLHEGLGRHGADQPGERVRQEVGQPSSSVLQHNIKTSQHSGRMMQQQSVAARHMLVQTGHMLDQGADMLDCAIAAGELARLAHQALKAHLDNGRCSEHCGGTMYLYGTSWSELVGAYNLLYGMWLHLQPSLKNCCVALPSTITIW
jgi:hypothetical protein